MTASPEKLASLRHLLAERFAFTTRPSGRVLPTGIPALDQVRGGLTLGAITEIVAHHPSSGSHLILAQLLALTRIRCLRVALIDPAACFDPESLPEDDLVHLLWVRGQTPTHALQATDLLVRDANLGLVCLDLRYARVSDLRRIPASQWYRLQRAAEPADLALLILTPLTCVPSAEARFSLDHRPSLAELDEERPALALRCQATLHRQRRGMATAG